MSTVTVKMLVTVEFNSEGDTAEELGRDMKRVIEYGMGTGMFTGSTTATVEDWRAEILETEGKTFDPERQISIVWGIEDVQSVRPDLTDDQAFAVLKEVEHRHDANIGINWDVLAFNAGSIPEPV